MRILKSLVAMAVVALCSMNAVAQTESCCGSGMCAEAQELGYKPYSYGFVQVQGGIGTTFTDVSCWKLLSPTFSVAVGDMFTPIVGARLHVNAWESKGGFDTMGQYYAGMTAFNQSEGGWELLGSPMKYKFNYFNTNVDLLINVFNIFSKKVHRPFDVYLVGGVGLNYAWHNKDFECITSQYNVGSDISNAWGASQTPRRHLLSHNLRLGLLADVNIAKNWSVGAEVDFNSLDDRFNSKYKDADDWMMTAQLSVTYKFGFKKVSKPAPPAPVIEKAPEPEPVEVVAPTPVEKPKPVVVEEPIKETLFYAIRESDVDTQSIINRVVAWCKKYPNKKITVDGYADKGTGNPKLNVGYAQKRAEKVAALLQEKGVPASQMTVNSYGDTVQPFPENDKNRCVIIEGK
ncbi:MAG: OmpA family protein [Bacteroidaceae bacterium]|nr:OmpA family protein [Bacteroidaceae bacterium]